MAAASFVAVIATVIVCHTRVDFQRLGCYKNTASWKVTEVSEYDYRYHIAS